MLPCKRSTSGLPWPTKVDGERILPLGKEVEALSVIIARVRRNGV